MNRAGFKGDGPAAGATTVEDAASAGGGTAETPASVSVEMEEVEEESGDESLPPHTSEIGTLKKLPNHGTAWLGSSSGVYFVNTVRRAFSAALLDAANTATIPASEDILTGEDADGQNYNGPVTDGPTVIEGDFRRIVLASLGRPPVDYDLAMELVTTYFRRWHPLFPFLHGPRFRQDIETIYAMPDVTATETYSPADARRVVTFQIVINIASLDRRDLHLPAESRIKSTSDVSRVAGCFAVDHDIAAIQLLIAAELYLVATISLRKASTVAGMILKLIYHAGLHRCPLRYAQLSLDDCEIRKRIFWSAYALDRHLSLSLGDPNTVQDNDIDVCLSGRELHKAVAHELIIHPGDEIKMHLPRPAAGMRDTNANSSGDDGGPRLPDHNEGPQNRDKAQREAAMTAYVSYGKLTGRIIEIFHKSIHARFQKPDAITFLNSDIETWWNDLPASLTNDDDDDEDVPSGQSHSSTNDSRKSKSKNPPNQSNGDSSSVPTHKQLAPFFLILYHQLQLLLNRPRLSLDQSTAAFQHGLQICIKASRNTLAALKKHRENGQSMLLPGLLSATWMAGLIIAFACQLGKYPKLRACSDISSCLTLLGNMGHGQWFTVKNCHKVLTLLLENIKTRKASSNGLLSSSQAQQRPGDSAAMEAVHTAGTGGGSGHARKRTLDSVALVDTASSPKRKSVGGSSPASSTEFKGRPSIPTATSGSKTPVSASTPNSMGGSTSIYSRQQPTQQSGSTGIVSMESHTNDVMKSTTGVTDANSQQSFAYADWSGTVSQQQRRDHERHGHGQSPFTNTSSYLSLPATQVSGSALYANPREMATAQSSHQLDVPLPTTGFGGEGLSIDDPMYWGTLDWNISDIFGAASWEHMTGGGGQMSTAAGLGPGYVGSGADPMAMAMNAGGGGLGMGPGATWADLFATNDNRATEVDNAQDGTSRANDHGRASVNIPR